MPFFIVRNDITKMKVDAIVNAANSSLLGGGGVDGAIHRAAGPMLLKECYALNGCHTGEAKITKGYDLPAKYVIHTVGPVWKDGRHGEDILLASCFSRSLQLAKEYGCTSVAFPLISTGAYGYPKRLAIQIAVDTIKSFIAQEDMEVYLVVYDKSSFFVSSELFADVKEYIGNNYEEEDTISRYRLAHLIEMESIQMSDCLMRSSADSVDEALDEAFEDLDESFSQMLFRLLDEKGISDVACYKKANVDRKVFSRIRNVNEYRPSKTTAVAFALALELPLPEAKRLIELAGYSLTHNNKFDIIIEYFILNKKYDIFEVNEVLFAFDQKLLGC